jgi:hypothetical protein
MPNRRLTLAANTAACFLGPFRHMQTERMNIIRHHNALPPLMQRCACHFDSIKRTLALRLRYRSATFAPQRLHRNAETWA